MTDIAGQIVAAGARPVIVQAVGGSGKSVLAESLGQYLPPDSVCITYDCFGNGGYRQQSEPRHENRQALLQLDDALLQLADPGLELLDELTECAILGLKVDVARYAG